MAELLNYYTLVPPAVRAIGYVADGFLVVCLVNAVGLLLAKFSSRAKELALRRALGASRGAVFRQCVTETLLIGLLGGMFGLALTAAGLSGLRALLALASRQGAPIARLVSLNPDMVVITMVTAIAGHRVRRLVSNLAGQPRAARLAVEDSVSREQPRSNHGHSADSAGPP
ncbi:MAG: FtsX-like permease family protein [Steroidobacteraceae bacterium]